MSSGLWINNDGLPLQYGVAKAYPTKTGEYDMPGPNRIIETRIDLSTLVTTYATVVDLNTILPSMANWAIEKVELFAEVAMSTSSSPTLSIGVCSSNLTAGSSDVYVGTTATTGYNTLVTTALIPTNGGTALVDTIPAASLATGALVRLAIGGSSPIGGDSYLGSYIGDYEDTTNLIYPMYLTATLGTATATGLIVCRVFMHGVGTIAY